MREYFDEYKLARKILAIFVLFILIFLSFYYTYNYISDLFIPNQVIDVDPLEYPTDSPKKIETMDSFDPLQSQGDFSETQNNILSIIEENKKITESEKIRIMRELGGNIK